MPLSAGAIAWLKTDGHEMRPGAAVHTGLLLRYKAASPARARRRVRKERTYVFQSTSSAGAWAATSISLPVGPCRRA